MRLDDLLGDGEAQADDLTLLYEQYSNLYGADYEDEARYQLAVRGKNDPRYPHLLRPQRRKAGN